MKRVCLYVRVSTDRQTTENQIQALREIADRSGYQIVKIYSDDGISGSKGRENRPALDQMMKDAVNRQFEMVMNCCQFRSTTKESLSIVNHCSNMG